MDFMKLISIDKSVSVILSMIVIYALIMIIRKAPDLADKIIQVLNDNAVATSESAKVTQNNTQMLNEVKLALTNTENIHIEMDKKLDNQHNKQEEHNVEIEKKLDEIVEKIDSLKCCVDEKAIPQIESLKEDVEELKKGTSGKGGD